MSNDTNDRGATDAFGDDTETVRHSWKEPFEPSVTIVEAVAAATGRTPTGLPTLQKHVDPDALDTLVTQGNADGITISFRYAGTLVTVEGNGAIEVRVDANE